MKGSNRKIRLFQIAKEVGDTKDLIAYYCY